MNSPDSPIESLLKSVQESSRYANVSPNLIRRLGARELMKRRSLKEAIKETKTRLHQIAGAYLEKPPTYAKWLSELDNLPEKQEDFEAALCRMMQYHASTRERIPFLKEFYSQTLADIRPIQSVIDVACGLNPLAFYWMGLEADSNDDGESPSYRAYDIYSDMMAFLGKFLNLTLDISSEAQIVDVVASPPAGRADIAFILKFLPLLEQTEGAVTLDWLKRFQTDYLLISYPTRTLGGRNVRMAENYEGRFREIMQTAKWDYQRLQFDTELAFVVKKEGSS